MRMKVGGAGEGSERWEGRDEKDHLREARILRGGTGKPRARFELPAVVQEEQSVSEGAKKGTKMVRGGKRRKEAWAGWRSCSSDPLSKALERPVSSRSMPSMFGII